MKADVIVNPRSILPLTVYPLMARGLVISSRPGRTGRPLVFVHDLVPRLTNVVEIRRSSKSEQIFEQLLPEHVR